MKSDPQLDHSINSLGFRHIDQDKQQYIIDKLLEKISDTRKRLDRYILILVVISALGFAYFLVPEFREDGFTFKVFNFIIPKEILSPATAIILLIVFGIVGSLLIDYIKNRTLFNLCSKHFFANIDTSIDLPNTNSEAEKEQLLHQIEVEQRKLISHVFIPASFHEWMFRLGYYDWFYAIKKLWYPVSIIILMVFYFSHFVALLHIIAWQKHHPEWMYFLLTVWYLAYVALYMTFVQSISLNSEKLGIIMKRSILGLLLFSVLLIFGCKAAIAAILT